MIEEIVAKEMFYITSYSQIVKLAELGYLAGVPYKRFWQGLMNVVLLNYHEMEINHVIQVLYHLSKMGVTEVCLDP